MRRSILAALVAFTLAPSAALAGHMTNYAYNPVEHDDQGRVDEPDFVSTGVLGSTVRTCFVEVPTAHGFAGRCTSPDLLPMVGQEGVLAPGCTGEDAQGQPVRRPSGTCGLWTVGVGAGPLAATSVLPHTIPQPVSEDGLPGEAAPGAFTPTKQSAVRFLDLRIIWSWQWFPLSVGANTWQLELNRKLADAGQAAGHHPALAGAVLPGGSIVHVWYGEWADLNGNGVVDHFTQRPGGPANEYAWLGACMDLVGSREPDAIALGLCKEDPNPNASPPGEACADPASTIPCARTTVHTWLWPGTHTASAYLGEFPGNQVGTWVFNGLSCEGDDALLFQGEDCDNVADPVLGRQDATDPDIVGELDTTGELMDSVRRWYAGTGWATPFYGDDGLLVTLVGIAAANCGIPFYGFPAYDLSVCTFTDVDKHPTVSPLAEQLLVGSHENPTGGLKGEVRGAWKVVRDL